MKTKFQDGFDKIGRNIPKKTVTPKKLSQDSLCEEINNIKTNMHKIKKVPKKRFSKKEIKYQQGVGVFLAFFCSFFAFLPFGAIGVIVVDLIFGKFLFIGTIFITSFTICILFFNYIFQKLAKKGKLEGWKWGGGPSPYKTTYSQQDNYLSDLQYKSFTSNIHHRRNI